MEARQRRPYAATANVIAVLNRARNRNLPETIGNDFLRIAGIPDAVFGRVTEAVRFLGLVNDDQTPSDLLRSIAAASDEEYRDLLATTIRTAYRDDFAQVDPGQDSQGQIVGQFQRYEPRSQVARMVMLFLGLCREAAIPVRDVPRERQMQQPRPGRTVNQPRPRTSQTTVRADRRPQTPPDPAPAGAALGMTETDIANLTDQEFDSVWAAMGTVTRALAIARARAHQQVAKSQDDETTTGDSP
jgi:uncharacterized protein YdbL (DUF1318 family)